jgi:hypothetical protein
MNRLTPARRLRESQRFSVWLLALVWCAVPVLSAVHASLEIHRYCAEHGTLEEIAGPVRALDAQSPSPGIRGVVGGESAHEDCVFHGLFRHVDSGGHGDTATADLAFADPVAPAEQWRSGGGVPLLHLAPKTSPPC